MKKNYVNRTMVAVRLRRWTERKYKTQQEAADDLDMTQPQLNDYLSGKFILGVEQLVKFHYKGCDMLWLLTGKRSESQSS